MTNPFYQVPESRLRRDPRPLGDGGQGRVYRVTAIGSRPPHRPLALKLYKPQWLNKINAEALKDLVRLRRRLAGTPGEPLIERTAWPETVVEAQGRPVGFLMPELPNTFAQPLHLPGLGPDEYVQVQHLLNRDVYLKRVGIKIDDDWRLVFLRDVAETIAILHRHGVTVGDLSPLNIYPGLRGAPQCFFVDCDAMQLHDRSVLPQVQTRGWEVPGREKTATIQSDAYKLALLAVRLFAGDQDIRDPAALSRCSSLLHELARDGLNIDPMSRPAPEVWAYVLRATASAAAPNAYGRTAAKATAGHRIRQPPSGPAPGQGGFLGRPSTVPLIQPRAQPPTQTRPQPGGPHPARPLRSRRLRLVAQLSLVSLFVAACLVGTVAFIDSRLAADPPPESSAQTTLTSAPEPTFKANGPVDTGKIYHNQPTGSCLQENESGIGTGDCRDPKSQWDVYEVADSESKVVLVNVVTKKCLEDTSQSRPRTTDCNPSNPSGQQIWLRERRIGVTIAFKNQDTGRCVEDSEYTTSCDGSSRSQRWY